jgi:hypothetical protein
LKVKTDVISISRQPWKQNNTKMIQDAVWNDTTDIGRSTHVTTKCYYILRDTTVVALFL